MKRAPAGISLMEVLISIFVISFGLLGLAALLPVGRFALLETAKADRSGACGRAAMREVKIRQLLDPDNWSNKDVLSSGRPFVIGPSDLDWSGLAWEDKLEITGLPGNLSDVFMWQDDLIFNVPEDPTLRPTALSNNPRDDYQGHYSWFMTVAPAPGEAVLHNDEKFLYQVSIVVCFQRSGDVVAQAVTDFHGAGYGGGGIRLEQPVPIKQNQWIMLHGKKQSGEEYCQWYRVAAAGESPTDLLSLVGPDWDPAIPTTAVIVDGAVAVFTTTVELDRHSIWARGTDN